MEMSKDGLVLMDKYCKLTCGNCLRCDISDICLKVCGGSTPKQKLNNIERGN